MPIKLYKQIIEYFSRYNLAKLKNIKLLEQPANLIKELRLLLYRLKYKICDFITININIMRIYYKKKYKQA
jgi:hypothetical protein